MENTNIGNTEADDIPEQPSLVLTREDVRAMIENAFDADTFLNEDSTVEYEGYGCSYGNRIVVYTKDYIIRIPIIWTNSHEDWGYNTMNMPTITVHTQEYHKDGKIVRESLPVKIVEA